MHRGGESHRGEDDENLTVIKCSQVFPEDGPGEQTGRGSVVLAPVVPHPEVATFMKVSMMYIRDAGNGRKPLPPSDLRVRSPGADAAVAAHALHWDWRVRSLFRLMVLFHVCILSELQCDAIRGDANGVQQGAYNFLTVLEALLCVLYFIDGFVQVRMHAGTWGGSWRKAGIPHKVTIMQLALPFVIVLDDVVSLATGNETVVAPFVRPLFILCFFENVNTIVVNVLKIIPDTLPTLFLLALHIGIFATVGHIFMRNYIFKSQIQSDTCALDCPVYSGDDPQCNGCEMLKCQVEPGKLTVPYEWIDNNCPGSDTWVWDRQSYFGTVSEAYTSLFICLTTSNFPDIVTPYIRSEYMNKNMVRAYFVIFLVLGRMILLNLCVGTIYNSYKERHRVSIGERLGFRKKALALLHDTLAEGGAHFANKAKGSEGGVAFERMVCVRLLEYMRTDLERDLINLFVETADSDKNDYLTATQMVQLCDVVMSVDAYRDSARSAWPAWRRKARAMVDWPWFDHITSFLVVVVFIAVLCQYTKPELVGLCTAILVSLTFVFAVEIFIRIAGKGFIDYWMEDSLHRIDLVSVSLAVALHLFTIIDQSTGHMSRTETAAVDSLAKVLVLARLSRIIQVVQVNNDLKRLVKIIASVLPIAMRYIVGLVFFISMFAPVGMALTAGAPTPVESAHGIANYSDNYIYGSFYEACFSLFVLWIGNNWHILMSGMVEQTSVTEGRMYHQVYFVLITTIFCTCVEAFIFDCIDCQTNLYHEHGTTEDKEPWMEEIDAAQEEVEKKGEKAGNLMYCKFWKVRAKVTIMDMYRRLFDEEDLDEFLADEARSGDQSGGGTSSLPKPPKLRAASQAGGGGGARMSLMSGSEPPRGSMAFGRMAPGQLETTTNPMSGNNGVGNDSL